MGNNTRRMVAVGGFIWASLSAVAGWGDVKPNNLFSDHLVLQSGVPVPVWGTAEAGENVTVSFAGQKQSAVAGGDGKWMVELAKLEAGTPGEMTIAGKNSVVVHDVLVGEVWVGSGQSNMQFSVGPSPVVKAYSGVTNAEKEIAAANYPQLRMYTVKPTLAGEPVDESVGEWEVCTPENVKDFSAVGYFFSRDLQRALKVPVGFINSSFGASCAEAWVSRAAMEGDPRLGGLLGNFDKAVSAWAARGSTPAPAATQAAAGGVAGRGKRAKAPRDPVQDQHNPTVAWNGMIHPIQPYAIRGVIWYQGESVIGGAAGTKLYPAVMEALVTSWRKAWNEGDFPFYVEQLAGQDAASNNPLMREAQAAVLSLPNTGMAVAIDIGEKKNVHPKDKQDVGDRLSRIALANVYGKSIEYSGPVYESMAVEGSSIRIKFSHLGGGLVAKGGELKTFVIAGADGKFVPAVAKIDGDTVVVSSAAVPSPANVRYAWMNWAEGCNLYNGAGLPAVPFRTDKE